MVLSAVDKKALQIGVFLAVLLGGLCGYYYFFFVKKEMEANAKRVEKLDGDIKELKSTYARMQGMLSRKDEIEAESRKILEVKRRLPDTEDAPGFLSALVNILRITNVVNERVAPEKTQRRNLYTEIPYTIECSSRYHDFGEFLTLVEQNPERFMRVKSFTIANDDTRPSFHPISVSLATFKFNKSSPAAIK